MNVYYTIYKITNNITGKFYYGKHKTTNLDDDYLGSGKRIKLAVLKYGKDSFVKQILFVYDNPYDMDKKEAEIVNEDLLKNKDCYNLALGGIGGFNSEIAKSINKDTIWINNGYTNRKIHKEDNCPEGWFLGLLKTHSATNVGGKSKGKVWITNGVDSTMINSNDLIPEGWYKGRTKKFIEQSSFSNKKGGEALKGYSWYTNGKINKRCKDASSLSSEWYKGRIKCN